MSGPWPPPEVGTQREPTRPWWRSGYAIAGFAVLGVVVILSLRSTFGGVQVTYEVAGTARDADITYSTPTGTSQQTSVRVPLRMKSGEMGLTQTFSAGAYVSIIASASPDFSGGVFGDLTCTIREGGKVISTNVAVGGGQADCSGNA